MLVDTSGIFSAIFPDDRDHRLAKRLLAGASLRLVHSLILAEFVALCEARRKSRSQSLRVVSSIVDRGEFKTIWLDEEDHRQAIALLHARPDKRYSLCDAASFILMRRMNLREALTTDHHFEQEGFVRLLK